MAETEVDIISGYTLAYPAEAIGIVRAVRHSGLAVWISLTVETDGCLPTGGTLEQAITQVDAETDGYCAYFMINCAHPDHLSETLTEAAWMTPVKWIVANATRCSHVELDEAEELDDGNPVALADQLADTRRRLPHIAALGECKTQRISGPQKRVRHSAVLAE